MDAACKHVITSGISIKLASLKWCFSSTANILWAFISVSCWGFSIVSVSSFIICSLILMSKNLFCYLSLPVLCQSPLFFQGLQHSLTKNTAASLQLKERSGLNGPKCCLTVICKHFSFCLLCFFLFLCVVTPSFAVCFVFVCRWAHRCWHPGNVEYSKLLFSTLVPSHYFQLHADTDSITMC